MGTLYGYPIVAKIENGGELDVPLNHRGGCVEVDLERFRRALHARHDDDRIRRIVREELGRRGCGD